MILWKFLFLGAVTTVTLTISRAACPCVNQSLCEPIKDTSRKEVFIFSVKSDETVWKRYDWTRITTLAMVKYVSPQLMCHAHQNNARAVILADYQVSDLLDPAIRHTWIQKQVKVVKDNYLDGINIIFDGVVPITGSDLKNALTNLVNETVTAFKKDLPFSQVSIDVPYGPNCVYNRCYDFKPLAGLVDFFFVMDYAEWTGEDYAGPNSDYQVAMSGMHDYLAVAPKEKLVMGVPWFGYSYLCYNATRRGHGNCYRSLNRQAPTVVPSRDIYHLQKSHGVSRIWDVNSRSPYFTYKDLITSELHQVWYDDAQSLAMKFTVATQYNLRGVGVWHADYVDYSDNYQANRLRLGMWNVLPSATTPSTIIG